MAAANAVIASLRVSLGLDSAQFTTGLRDASATMAREAAKQQKAADDLARRVTALKSALDPVYAAQRRLGDQMKEAQALYKAGAISGAEYGKAMGDLAQRLKAVSTAQAATEKNTRALSNAGLNLGRQFADIGTQLAQPGVSPFLVLAQQGPQILDAFQTAKQQGLSFGTVVKDLAGIAGRFAVQWGPALVVAAAAAGAFLLWKKNTEDLAAAMKAQVKVAQEFTAVQNSTRDALGQAADFADKYKVSNNLLTEALDAVLVSQNKAYAETLASVDANDAAGRAAVRRAELERLLTVSILKRAAAEATARAGEAEGEAKKAEKLAARQGFFAQTAEAYRGAEGGVLVDPVTVGEQAENRKAKELNIAATRAAAKQEREYAKSLNAAADALLNSTLTIPPATEGRKGLTAAERAAAKAARDAARAQEEFNERVKDLLRSLETPSERAIREYAEQTALLRQALDGGKISAEKYREAIDRLNPVIVSAKDAQKALSAEFASTPADLAKGIKGLDTAAEKARDLADAFEEARFSFDDLLDSLKSGNIGRFIGNVQGLIQSLSTLLQAGPEGILSVGALVANTVGGKTGRAIGGGLGIAAGGVGLGTAAALGGLGAGAFGGAVAALAGPIGIAAGVLYAAAKLLNVGGKPSNKGAGFDLVTGQLSGDKRSSETEEAARSAGQAILGIQDALKAAGIGVKDAVTGLVIGTRDQTQIYLQSGRELRSAVGDAGAAVDTALRALLEGATYVSDAQRKLVESALSAGKGFDAIQDILTSYEAAQRITGTLADQIKQLTDPKAFDLEAVRREIEAQRKAYAQLAADGYLTADQLATVNAQLATLEGLKLDDVLKRYTDALEEAEEAIDTTPDTLKAVNDAAGAALLEAYNVFAQAKQAEIQALAQAADSLAAFRRELNIGAIAGRSRPSQLAATRSEFQRLAGLTPTDPERLANLQGVAQAFLEASRAGSTDELSFRRDLAAVRRATEASQNAARSQAEVLQAQLDAQTQMLTQLGLLVSSNQDMAQALKAYLASQQILKAAGVANDNGFNAAAYGAANPDLIRNWMAGGTLRGLGATLEEALLANYLTAGQYEIAAGLRTRGFATGGSFKVGGAGGLDSQLMKFWASPGEMVNVTKGDPQAAMAAGLSRIDQRLALLEQANVQALGYQRRMEKVFRKWDADGLPAERDVA